MSKVNRDQIKKLVLKEMRMLGMADMSAIGDPPPDRGCDACGMSPCDCGGHEDEYSDDSVKLTGSSKGTVSREDCCAAIMCLIECCECPITRSEIERCCGEIMSGQHDR